MRSLFALGGCRLVTCSRVITSSALTRVVNPVLRLRLRSQSQRRSYAQDTTELFNAFANVSAYGIDLKHKPKVVIVGEQSSGKTRVISDAFIGFDIFPVGMKMATMKPYDITTIRSEETKFIVGNKEIGEKEYRVLQQITDEINRLNNNNHVPIVNLKTYSPTAHNLNFVDTPGMVAVSTLSKKIKAILEPYLKDPNCILLLIHPASSDIATDHALKQIINFGRLEDTLGVLSKIDLIEGKQDTDFIERLVHPKEDDDQETKQYLVGHGWHCLSLRSDKDIAAGMTTQEKAKSEKELLARMKLPGGVENVRKRVSDILFSKIKDQIPNIIKDIDAQIAGLKSSQSFLHDLINNDQKKLAGRLSEMVEKLSKGSTDRKEFETCLKKELNDIIGKYLEETLDPKKNHVPEFVSGTFDKSIFAFHHQHQTKPDNFKVDGIKELFSYGPLPLYTDTPTVTGHVKNEQQLAACLNMIAPVVDDPDNIKKGRWNRYLNAYFDKLLADDTIHKIIFGVTKDLLLQFINNDLSDNDEVTKKFAEYMVNEISGSAFGTTIKATITAIVSLEKRPEISYYELVRYIAQMYPQFFTFKGNFFEPLTHENKKLKLEVYGDDWNEAYLRAVARSLANNSYRNIAVNLLDKMIRMLMEMTIDMFNKEQALKEQKKVNEKVAKLTELRTIISSFMTVKKKASDETVYIRADKLTDVHNIPDNLTVVHTTDKRRSKKLNDD